MASPTAQSFVIYLCIGQTLTESGSLFRQNIEFGGGASLMIFLCVTSIENGAFKKCFRSEQLTKK